jgi:glycosyltransferase involved in cell wall biosynthesis
MAASWILKTIKTVLFAENEAEEMRRQFGAEVMVPARFGVDESYWSPGEPGRPRSGVLAIGNDGRRDYKTLLDAAALLPDVPFKIVTRIPLGQDIPSNVEHIHGDWKTDSLSDAALRDLYRASACVVVPLEESIQPSGQSVAMQAMMCGASVVMTRTAGWWGAEVLRSGDHLLEVPPKNPETLAAAISRTLASPPGLHARQALLAADWTTKGFAQRLEKVAGG